MAGKVPWTEYVAACTLAGVAVPIYKEEQQWYALRWTAENWEAFLAVNEAYGVFDMKWARNNKAAGKIRGEAWLPVMADTFDLSR